jgi:hypothetical protein
VFNPSASSRWRSEKLFHFQPLVLRREKVFHLPASSGWSREIGCFILQLLVVARREKVFQPLASSG